MTGCFSRTYSELDIVVTSCTADNIILNVYYYVCSDLDVPYILFGVLNNYYSRLHVSKQKEKYLVIEI